MQNVHVGFRAKFHVLSNGALVFFLSLTLCTCRKIDTTIHQNFACIQPAFSACIGTYKKTNTPFERA